MTDDQQTAPQNQGSQETPTQATQPQQAPQKTSPPPPPPPPPGLEFSESKKSFDENAVVIFGKKPLPKIDKPKDE